MPSPWFEGLLLATLAYPDANDNERRTETAFRVVTWAAMESAGQSLLSWQKTKLGDYDIAYPVDFERLNRGRGHFEGQLRRRLLFGMLIMEPLMACDQKSPLRHIRGGKWNRSAAIRSFMEKNEIGDRGNFDRDYWRPARPVAHLAAAFFCENRGSEQLLGRKVESKWDLASFINEPAYSDALVNRARAFEPIVGESDLGIPESMLIKFRP